MTSSTKSAAASNATNGSMHVDYDIGEWIVTTDNGKHAILIVTDIDEFCDTIKEAKSDKTLKSLRQTFERSLNFIEFGPVQILKGGMVKWKGGDFVE
ncbi:MAG: hypothetical protein NT123_24185 [Proteobacteria bacterium]|nr:hypothetical protein [Pseudomonadota bacterium]